MTHNEVSGLIEKYGGEHVFCSTVLEFMEKTGLPLEEVVVLALHPSSYFYGMVKKRPRERSS